MNVLDVLDSKPRLIAVLCLALAVVVVGSWITIKGGVWNDSNPCVLLYLTNTTNGNKSVIALCDNGSGSFDSVRIDRYEIVNKRDVGNKIKQAR